MRDTTPQIEQYLHRRYCALSGVERLVMGARMFETARALALAFFPPGLSQQEIRRRLCERFYGALAGRVYRARVGHGVRLCIFVAERAGEASVRMTA